MSTVDIDKLTELEKLLIVSLGGLIIRENEYPNVGKITKTIAPIIEKHYATQRTTLKAELLAKMPKKRIGLEPDPTAGYWCKLCNGYDECDCGGFNDCLADITKIVEEL